jgi:flagellar assembly protein FliH
MSSRAQRLPTATPVHRFHWDGAAGGVHGSEEPLRLVGPAEPPALEPELPATQGPTPAEVEAHLAALEREAFTKGYAAGERAGAEAGARRADAMLRRVAQTIESLAQLRRTIVQQTEHQVVDLALTLARRVVHRELSLDPQLVAALAHVALERLGERAPATIRLHPDDYATVLAQRGEQWEGTQVTVVPDAAVARGGCLVESDFGMIDGSVDAQFDELTRSLLGDEVAPVRQEIARGG